ncbi:hypothetical protein QBC46DRAFT_394087 [Diplogelasinospora grovesii]|uniref:C2H2-type domain-containing protein n=1 Tax=Diplogelasinospora grovesii TaxID=303347 RepID=A0AAN6N1H1_9PEZI|nr:hypothetical protein QBC46DRAFT_394087 [Diplogelasinospora grovesii]
MGNFHFECSCGKQFPAGWRARENHCKATGHIRPRWECDTCHRYFTSDTARWQHMEAVNHFAWECAICDETWPTEKARREHEAEEHHYCCDCDRTFTSYNNMKMHLNSSTHRGTKICCPFCSGKYATATGLVHHLESGSCAGAPNLNRDQIYRMVRSKDPSGMISKNLIGWTGSSTYEATDRAWNGSAWECYFCHRQFGQMNSLNQHLKSPTHQQALYHCPKASCRMEFKTLAAIINHFESETCGFTRFENVQNRVGDMIKGGKLIGF